MSPHDDAGDWRQWDNVWHALQAGSDAILYTADSPKTILQFWQRAYFEDLWALMGPRRDTARYLELGSGRGTTSMYLASKGCDVTLVDMAPTALQLAVRNFRSRGLPDPRTVIADARETGLPAASVDCVYNIGLLEHFDDPRPVLRESLRLLKPGGLLFMVIVPEGSSWQSLPVRLTLNPAVTGLRLVKAVARRLSTRLSSHPRASDAGVDPSGSEMVRTNHSRQQYDHWMRELGEGDVRCLPYNPYFQVYRSAFLERHVTMPLYRAHLRFRAAWRTPPLLVAAARRTSCYLLVCRKTSPDITRG